MKESLLQIKTAAAAELAAGTSTEEVRIKYLGKKGELTAILRSMGGLSADQRPVMGALANEVREYVEGLLSTAAAAEADKLIQSQLDGETIDVTAPGTVTPVGALHPITQCERQLCDIFCSMGFDIAEGFEIETDYYNFQAMNIPENHPARDTQDTFYFTESMLLRTHTSPVQARVMEVQKPPIRIVSPGRVYRSDAVDATHSPAFHQLEGLVVDRGITMGDLRGILEEFARKMFGGETRIRFRPHHFQFTEPSAEVDVSCFVCNSAGCRLCKGEGWIEILGAGMVH
ncbi:MAG: phenylalanine--tRNA ligase subunit alpha, partial [Oscillospiraceae bacterium]|nr:phenylalanine--tRNA ligase subunit alpha [Oscillospiraceae bacterium]